MNPFEEDDDVNDEQAKSLKSAEKKVKSKRESERTRVQFDPDAINQRFISSDRDEINSKGEHEDDLESSKKENLKYLTKDTKVILLFIFLYTIQSIPSGLSSSIPMILSSKKASMQDQGIFSFANWPIFFRLIYVSFFITFDDKKSISIAHFLLFSVH